MKISTQISLTTLATLVSSTAIHTNRRASPLTIELSSVGNSAVKAILANTGSEGLNLLKTGTLLDEKPTEKVQVYNAKGKITFKGLKLRVSTSGLTEASFTYLGAGETKEIDIEVASLHDLSEGGNFDILSAGALPYALDNSTTLTGAAIPFFSNKLSIAVDGAQAAKVSSALRKRTDVSNDCKGSKLNATITALNNCADLSATAAKAAESGDEDKFLEFFKSASNRKEVVGRFEAIAKECGSASAGATETHCTDTYNACDGGVLAYTAPSENYVVNCPLYFSALPDITCTCHEQDQATTTLHEMAHAPGVYSPGTDDLGYGYEAAMALSASQAIDNADTFALFANAIYSKC